MAGCESGTPRPGGRGRPSRAMGPVSDLAFGAEGARVVAAWPDEMVVRLVETSSGRELWRHEGPLVERSGGWAMVRGPARWPTTTYRCPAIVGLSPDGRQVAVGPGQTCGSSTPTRGSPPSNPCPPHTARGPSIGARTDVSSRRQGWGGAHDLGRRDGRPARRRVRSRVRLEHPRLEPRTRGAWRPGRTSPVTSSSGTTLDGRLDGVPHPRLGGDEPRRGQPRLLAGRDPPGSWHDRRLGGQGVGPDARPALAEMAIIPATGEYGDVGFSQDDRQVVSADEDGFVRLHDLETGDVSAAIGPRVAEHDLDVSPDGRWLVHGPAIWDLTTGSERVRFAEPPPFDGTGWSADSRLLAIVSGVEGSGRRGARPGRQGGGRPAGARWLWHDERELQP